MISYGKKEWIPQMKHLWKEVFGDEDEYLDAFFSQVYQDQNTLVYLDGETIVSVLFMVDYMINHQGNQEKAVYLYALATNPDFRGQKIMSRLIEKSIEVCKQRDYDYQILIPANTDLFTYYGRFGFETCGSLVKVRKTRREVLHTAKSFLEAAGNKTAELIAQEAQIQPVVLSPANHRQIWLAYCNSVYFHSQGVRLTEQQNEFYLQELKKEGGQAFVFDMEESEDGYVLLKCDQKTLEIYETNVDEDTLPAFYQALTDQFIFDTVEFHQPSCFHHQERKRNETPFAMGLSLKGRPIPRLLINRVLM